MKRPTRKRFARVGSIVFILLIQAACGQQGLGTHAPPDGASPLWLDDSGTLDVRIWVIAGGDGEIGANKETVRVSLGVSVRETATGSPVANAVVKGGPVGRMVPIAPDPVPAAYPGGYDGVVTGYDGAWEFSVVRGADHLTGVVVVGPSYQAIGFSPMSNGATIDWWPAHEANVTTFACATDELSPPSYQHPPRWCAQTGDEGSVMLTPSEQEPETIRAGKPAAFPSPGGIYRVSVRRQVDLPLGTRGRQLVMVEVESDVALGP